MMTHLLSNEEGKHSELIRGAKKKGPSKMPSIAAAAEGVTHEYNKTAETGIENMRCRNIKLRKGCQFTTRGRTGERNGQDRNA
jgi:hypothetical protein